MEEALKQQPSNCIKVVLFGPESTGKTTLSKQLARYYNSVWVREAYYSGTCDPILDAYALKNSYDLYFLTYIDTPWEADDLRDKPNERKRMFNAFETALKTYNKPYVLLKGSKEERLQIAVEHIDNLLKKKL